MKPPFGGGSRWRSADNLSSDCYTRPRGERYDAAPLLRSKKLLGDYRVIDRTHRLLASTAALIVCTSALAQEQDFSAVKIETHAARSDGLLHARWARAATSRFRRGRRLGARRHAIRAAEREDPRSGPRGRRRRREVRHEHALARRPHGRQRAARQGRRRDHRARQRARAHEHRAVHGRAQSGGSALARGRASRPYVPDPRHVPLEWQHRERRARRERAHRRRLDRAVHERRT